MTADRVITSFLDTDLYKLTMQAAIHLNYPNTKAEFLLTNRTPTKKLNKAGYEWLVNQIQQLSELRFTDDEIEYLKEKLSFIDDAHFEWLAKVTLNPENEVIIEHDVDNNGFYNITITASGDWDVVTLYEIPILSLLSECYFRFIDTKWSIKGAEVAEFENGELVTADFEIVERQAYAKAKALIDGGCKFSEFGTRRRRSFDVQYNVIKGIVSAAKTNNGNSILLGTSNVMLAKEFGIQPVGTIGHEWMMGIGAITSNYGSSVDYSAYLRANKVSMLNYHKLVGDNHMGLALTDTYGTDNYLNSFDDVFVDRYIGVRQDSGDPELYARKISSWYVNKGYVGDKKKMICFSDSLNVDKCLRLNKLCDEELDVVASFGIGTNFTNDFDSSPMNIVMKLIKCGGGNAIKLSDDIGKNMGDMKTVSEVKSLMGYVEKSWEFGDESKRWDN